jgi:hypothetical protein
MRLGECLQASGMLEIALAALQVHFLGMLLGVVGTLTGFYLTGATSMPQFTLGRWFRAISLGALMMVVLLWLLILVRLASGMTTMAAPFNSFPSECPSNRGCARLTWVNPHGLPPGTAVPMLPGALSSVSDAVQDMIGLPTQSYPISPRQQLPTYLQTVWMSTFWGFPDDVAFQVSCNETLTQVQVHSQQRGELAQQLQRPCA